MCCEQMISSSEGKVSSSGPIVVMQVKGASLLAAWWMMGKKEIAEDCMRVAPYPVSAESVLLRLALAQTRMDLQHCRFTHLQIHAVVDL